MEEYGVVITTKDTTALVRAEKTSACESCASKNACKPAGTGAADMLIEADNPVGARVGDHVVFTVAAGSILKAGMLLYLAPVVAFIVGVVAGQKLIAPIFPGHNPDLVTGLTGAALLAAAFIAIKLWGRLSGKKGSYRPQIMRVVQLGH